MLRKPSGQQSATALLLNSLIQVGMCSPPTLRQIPLFGTNNFIYLRVRQLNISIIHQQRLQQIKPSLAAKYNNNT
jgi:hypothetical protein